MNYRVALSSLFCLVAFRSSQSSVGVQCVHNSNTFFIQPPTQPVMSVTELNYMRMNNSNKEQLRNNGGSNNKVIPSADPQNKRDRGRVSEGAEQEKKNRTY